MAEGLAVLSAGEWWLSWYWRRRRRPGRSKAPHSPRRSAGSPRIRRRRKEVDELRVGELPLVDDHHREGSVERLTVVDVEDRRLARSRSFPPRSAPCSRRCCRPRRRSPGCRPSAHGPSSTAGCPRPGPDWSARPTRAGAARLDLAARELVGIAVHRALSFLVNRSPWLLLSPATKPVLLHSKLTGNDVPVAGAVRNRKMRVLAPGLNGFQLHRSCDPASRPPGCRTLRYCRVRRGRSRRRRRRCGRSGRASRCCCRPCYVPRPRRQQCCRERPSAAWRQWSWPCQSPGRRRTPSGAGLAATKAGAASAPSASASVSEIVAGSR